MNSDPFGFESHVTRRLVELRDTLNEADRLYRLGQPTGDRRNKPCFSAMVNRCPSLAPPVIIKALLAIVWISIFSGTALHIDRSQSGALKTALDALGPEKMLYAVFADLPLSAVTTPLLVFCAYISFVTAADSNTDAIGNLCTRGVTAESAEGAGLGAKVLWGSTIGIVAWTMVSFAGVDGIRMLSNLGGIAAVAIVLAASLSLVRWLLWPKEAQRLASHSEAQKKPTS